MLDPSIRRLLDSYFAAPAPAGPPAVAALRAATEAAPVALGGAPEDVVAVADRRIAGPAGALPLRVYCGPGAGARPLYVYAHGGGWVTGSLDSHDRVCRILANRLAAHVVAVDYRCAPEHVFPAALDDVDAAWRWTVAHAAELGADPARLAVAGDSSGGNLVAALALRLRARGDAQPVQQLLLYPALDAAADAPSYAEFATGHNLTAAQMRWYWDAYRAGAPAAAFELAPAAAADLAGVAPAVIAVAEADVLRDEGLAYAARLAAAGVPVATIRCAGMIHGFLRWTGAVPAALRWFDAIAAAARL
jgi:acetyl esterase